MVIKMAHPYCLITDVGGRLGMTYAEILNDWDNLEEAAMEASCYVDSEIQCYTNVPLVLSNCCIRYATADLGTGIYKRRTFRSKAGFESFDTRYWWDMGIKKLRQCIKSTWFCGKINFTDYGDCDDC